MSTEPASPSTAEPSQRTDRHSAPLGEPAMLGVLAVACALLFFYGLGGHPLWDIDEGMHAATAKTMVESGDWVVPTMNGEPFPDKPILHTWLIALSFTLLGFSEFAARLPAALAGSGCVLATYLLGRRMFGRRAAFLGALALATSALVVVLSRVVVHDISLALCVTASLLAFHAAYRAPRPRLGTLVCMYVLLGLAALAKGPIGLVLPGLPMVALIARDRRWSFLREMRPVLGALIVLAIAAPWFVLMSQRVPGYAYYFFVERHVGGFISGDKKGSQPLWAYLPVLAGGLLPWTPLLPLALVRAVRARASASGGDLVFLLAWFGAGFMLLSLSSAKLPTYILPLFPPLALLVGRTWDELFATRSEALRRAFSWSLAPFALVLVLAAIGVWIWPLTRLEEKLSVDSTLAAVLASGVAVVGVLGLVAVRRRAWGLHLGAYLALPILMIVLFVEVLAPTLSRHRASKEMSLLIDRLLPPGEAIPTLCYLKDGALFYTSRLAWIMPGEREFAQFMRSTERVYCLVDEDDIHKARRSRPRGFVVARLGDTYIVSNRRGPLPLEDEPSSPAAPRR